MHLKSTVKGPNRVKVFLYLLGEGISGPTNKNGEGILTRRWRGIIAIGGVVILDELVHLLQRLLVLVEEL